MKRTSKKFFAVSILAVSTIFAMPARSAAQDGGFGQQMKSILPRVQISNPFSQHGGFGLSPAPEVAPPPPAAQDQASGTENASATAPAPFPFVPDSTSSHITHYKSDDNGQNGDIPRLAGTVVSIQFSGPVGDKTQRELMQLGVRDFSDVCYLPNTAVICFRYQESVKGPRVDDSGSSYGGGQNGQNGYSWNGNGGEDGVVNSIVTLVDLFDGEGNVIPLGKLYRSAFVGNNYSSGSSSYYSNQMNRGGTFGGYSNENMTIPESSAYGEAVMYSINHLLDKGKGRKGKAKGWLPGASEVVDKFFKKNPVISRR